jgi:hypothetical protein
VNPYRVSDPPHPFVSVEPDPFPAFEDPVAQRIKRVENIKRRAAAVRERLDDQQTLVVALAARHLVQAAKLAKLARESFPGSAKLHETTGAAVERSFVTLAEAVEGWKPPAKKR